jgi:hypothetical protein
MLLTHKHGSVRYPFSNHIPGGTLGNVEHMVIASEKDSTATIINVFTVAPANQQRLVDLLTRATDGFVNRAPGFISATLHRSAG